MSQKNNFIFLGLLILISLGIILGLGLNLKQRSQSTPTQPPTPAISQPTQEPQQKPEPIDTSNWKTYRNEKYGFEVRYPEYYGSPYIEFIKYPADWEMEISETELNRLAPGVTYLRFKNKDITISLTDIR